MNQLIRFDPFELVEGVLSNAFRPVPTPSAGTPAAWSGVVPIDVAENDQSYTLWVDLPGVSKEDVEVSVHGREVTITAQFKRENAVEQGQGREQFLRRERPYGAFSRTISFPSELDDGKAVAQCRDGVLVLTLPKHESAQVRRLPIH